MKFHDGKSYQNYLFPYYFEIKDSSKLMTRAEDYKYDKSLKGEFIRLCLDDDSLSDEEKEKMLESIKRQGLSRDSIYESLRIFARYYDVASDFDKKRFVHSFIKCIELYPEKSRKSGCPIKTIHFSFPVSYEGKSVYGIHYDRPINGEISPGHLMTAESIVTLTQQ